MIKGKQLLGIAFAAWLASINLQPSAFGVPFVLDIPAGGSVNVDVPHAGSRGSLVTPLQPTPAAFRPPAIFSAPLPSGSGARALGLAGAFTAVADDAIAASWNPAGLIQLETPEASLVLRHSTEKNDHRSTSDTLLVGEDEFDNFALNYLSAVFPFRVAERNYVFSLNYQEVYDFEQRFTAMVNDQSTPRTSDRESSVFTGVFNDTFSSDTATIDLTSTITTRTESRLEQTLESTLLSSLEFDQEGVIDAITPAFALEITPNLSVGVALNYYMDSLFGNRKIRSRSHSAYSGQTISDTRITDERVSTGTYVYAGTVTIPGATGLPPVTIPIIPPTSGTYGKFSETTVSHDRDVVEFDGTVEEINEFNNLHGYNANFGILWTVSRFLSLGVSVDLPWTAKAEQKRTVNNEITTFNSGRTRILDQSVSSVVEVEDIELHFPLYWAVGAALRFTDKLQASLDVSQTLWSDFYFKANGQKTNPLDGTPHGENKIDDTIAVRGGIEYLMVFPKTEVPLRGGVAYEQRPSVGRPDEFWHLALGTGISMGGEEKKVIIDFAYILTYGENVFSTLLPSNNDLITDVIEHETFLSVIIHF